MQKSARGTLATKKAILIIAITGIIVFSNMLFNSFVGDDDSQIVGNVALHSIENINALFTGSSFYNGGQNLTGVYYKPILVGIFSMLYSFFGPNPLPFHSLQLILHIFNACLLFIFLKHFFRKFTALLLSLIFLLHPINSEAVFYISAMQEVLFFFFGIIALSLLLRKSQRLLVLLFVTISLLLSVFSKETGILFVVIALVYVGFFSRKLLYPLLGISIAMVAVYVPLRINAVGILAKSAVAPIDKLTLLERFYNMPLIFLFYIKTFFSPLYLASSYQWAYKQTGIQTFFLPLVVDMLFLTATFVFGVFLHNKYEHKYVKTYVFFVLWFLMGMLLHMQIIPLDVTLAERWFYFPIVGILGMTGVLLDIVKVERINKWQIVVAVTVLISLLSARTFMRSFDWRDDFTLASHDILVSQDAYDLESILSYEYIRRGEFNEAKTHAEKSIQLYPYFTNYNNLGLAYVGLGDYAKAKEAYARALDIGEWYMVYENLGGLTLVYGDTKENLIYLKNAISKFPQDATLWLYLAVLEYKNGDSNNAKKAIEQAYSLNPNSEDISYIYNIMINDRPLKLNFKIR